VVREISNTFIPANGLPPEILSRVLEYRTRERDLVAATQVCRYWRSTLISSPSLWTCFQFQSSHDFDRTLTYLERSKSAPIDVSVSSDWSRNFDVLEYLAPHISRTRSLVFQASQEIQTACLLFCNPAPLLEHLAIFASGRIVHLPDNFLSQQTPSLRSVNLSCVYPKLETLFPLPNLTEFHLFLPDGTGPFSMGALFRFFSDSPLLQKIGINNYNQTVQDVSLDRVISLESLVELDYTCNSISQILPFLKLPRLRRLHVSYSLGSGQVQTLADILPHDGRVFLAGATKMFYHSDPYARTHRLELSGSGVGVSFSVSCTTFDPAIVDWFSDRTYIPFGRIEDLKVGGSPASTGFHINVLALENLRVLQIGLWDGEFTRGLLDSLHPGPMAEIPCRSLQEIEVEYTYWNSEGSLPGLLISLVRERKRAGHQLRLVRILYARESERDLVEELREHVGEVRTNV
jgi:hypothetical protein